jgi:hypothetical protein
MPTPKMRLFLFDDNYFESIEELNIIDYYRSLAGCSDVIRKSNSNTSMLYTLINKDGYGLYNKERSIYCEEFI